MRYVPEQKNIRLVNSIMLSLFVFGGISYAIPIVCESQNVSVTMPWLFTLLTLVSVVTAVFFLVRYRMTGFTYLIRPRSDIPENGMEAVYADSCDVTQVRPDWLDLVVLKSQGNKPGVMECVLSLGDLVAIIPVSSRKADGKSTIKEVRDKYREGNPSGFIFYDYTLSFMLDEALELIFIDGNRYVGIVLEVDGVMKDYLMQLKK